MDAFSFQLRTLPHRLAIAASLGNMQAVGDTLLCLRNSPALAPAAVHL